MNKPVWEVIIPQEGKVPLVEKTKILYCYDFKCIYIDRQISSDISVKHF